MFLIKCLEFKACNDFQWERGLLEVDFIDNQFRTHERGIKDLFYSLLRTGDARTTSQDRVNDVLGIFERMGRYPAPSVIEYEIPANDNECDIFIKWDTLKDYKPERTLRLLRSFFPDRGLYSLSEDWRNNPKYILKARGTMGDVLVKWL